MASLSGSTWEPQASSVEQIRSHFLRRGFFLVTFLGFLAAVLFLAPAFFLAGFLAQWCLVMGAPSPVR